MDTTSITQLVALFLGLGAVTTFLTGALKRLSTWVDNLPPLAKSALAWVVALFTTWLGTRFGVKVPGDISTWNIPVVSSILTAVISWGWHSFASAISKSSTTSA